ncbi:hypothetical protein GGP87_000685 [Salinibacter ruber]|nr:hypothetical protein [Salinibacter ruber]MCS3866429.1 hypothetical protein [Salinibacter ruber]MCS4048918.1 hypothetical protein [Salinibacter ruber]
MTTVANAPDPSPDSSFVPVRARAVSFRPRLPLA